MSQFSIYTLSAISHNGEKVASRVFMFIWHPAFPLHHTPLLGLTLSGIVIIALFSSHSQTATASYHMRYSGSATLSCDVFLQLLHLAVHHS